MDMSVLPHLESVSASEVPDLPQVEGANESIPFGREQIKYMHLRPINVDGKGLEISNCGGITVAFQATEDEIYLNIAWCSDRDNFSRAEGRKIASGRLIYEGPIEVLGHNGHPYQAIVDWCRVNLLGDAAIWRSRNTTCYFPR